MARLPLGPWRPDVGTLNADGLADMRNAFFAQGGWLPEKALVNVSEQPTGAPVQGMFAARRGNGDPELFIATNGRIRRVPSRTGTLQDVSKAGGYSTAPGDRFRAVQQGNLLVLTNLAQNIQAYVLGGAAANFADLAASAPKGRYIAVVRDLIAVAHLITLADGEDRYAVAWHGFTNGIPDPTSWTPSVATQADQQRISDIGAITGLTGGEFGTVVGTDGICRMTYVGSPIVYQFDVVERRLGCRVPESVVQYRQLTFFYSPAGFQAFDGQSVRGIGQQKVDRFFARDLDEARCAQFMWAAPDVDNECIRWLYPARGMRQDRANRIITYHLDLDEFSITDIEAQCLGQGRTFGADLDDPIQFPDLDAGSFDLDDPKMSESLPATLAIDDNRLRAFSGGTMPATFTLAERELSEDRRTMLQRVEVVHEGGSSSIRIGVRQRFDKALSWSPEVRQRDSGLYEVREPAQSHQLRVTLDGEWRRALAVSLYGKALGRR